MMLLGKARASLTAISLLTKLAERVSLFIAPPVTNVSVAAALKTITSIITKYTVLQDNIPDINHRMIRRN